MSPSVASTSIPQPRKSSDKKRVSIELGRLLSSQEQQKLIHVLMLALPPTDDSSLLMEAQLLAEKPEDQKTQTLLIKALSHEDLNIGLVALKFLAKTVATSKEVQSAFIEILKACHPIDAAKVLKQKESISNFCEEFDKAMLKRAQISKGESPPLKGEGSYNKEKSSHLKNQRLDSKEEVISELEKLSEYIKALGKIINSFNTVTTMYHLAARSLTKAIKDNKEVEIALWIAKEKGDEKVCIIAKEALDEWDLEKTNIELCIRELLDASNPDTRASAAKQLRILASTPEIQKALLHALKAEKNREAYNSVARALSTIAKDSKDVQGALIGVLFNPQGDKETVNAAAEALAHVIEVNSDVEIAFIKSLNHFSNFVPDAIFKGLKKIVKNNIRVQNVLIKMIENCEHRYFQEAVEVLSKVIKDNPKEIIPPLIEGLKKCKYYPVRIAILNALAKVSDYPIVYHELLQTIVDPDFDVAQAAAKALSGIESEIFVQN